VLEARPTELHDGVLAAATSRAGVAASVASALRWLGRGQSCPALVREVAWTAARGVGAGKDELEWLSALIDARLAARFDDLPRVARGAALMAEAEHLSMGPHDHEGADLVAELAAHDAVLEQLSIASMDLLDWGVGLLRERRRNAPRRGGRWLRRSSRQCDEPAPCEVPQRIFDGLTLRSGRPGWLNGRAA
jgi:hypothetical protein